MMRALMTLLFALILLLVSCGEPSQDRINRLVKDRVDAERHRLESACRKELIAQAVEVVDSLIIEKALRDTSAIFQRPIRPDVPNLNIPDIDTLGIKPLFGESEE